MIMKSKQRYILWAVLIVAALSISALIPLTDPSEARYATIAKTMVQTGDVWAPHVWVDGKLIPFMGKPPLGFWMMAGAMKLFGINEFSARLPSVFSAILLLVIMFTVLNRYFSRDIAVASSLITLTTTSFFVLANTAMVDAVLMLFSMGAVFFYYAYLSEETLTTKKNWSRLVFIFLGLAFITKGPVGLVYFGVPVFLWTLFGGHWATLKNHAWITGGLLFLGITVPCFYYLEKGMPGFLDYFFIHENFLRYTQADYGDLYSSTSHKLFVGAAIPMTLGACAPWVLVPFYTLIRAVVSSRKKEATHTGQETPMLKQWFTRVKKTLKTRESLFVTGLVGLMLFWSLANQIMFYYLILLVPLFSVWCAGYMRDLRIPVPRIARVAVILLISYVLICIPGIFIVNRTSSFKEAVKKSVALGDENGYTGRCVVFVRRMPYSGYFYGGNHIVGHGKEAVQTSIERGLKNPDTIFIMKTKYFKEIPENLRVKLTVREKNNDWMIATMSEANPQESVAE